jgi:hypothetical protein
MPSDLGELVALTCPLGSPRLRQGTFWLERGRVRGDLSATEMLAYAGTQRSATIL